MVFQQSVCIKARCDTSNAIIKQGRTSQPLCGIYANSYSSIFQEPIYIQTQELVFMVSITWLFWTVSFSKASVFFSEEY